MTVADAKGAVRLLIVNPNSSRDMSNGMEKAIRSMDLPPSVQITIYTGPATSPASINGGDDIQASADACLKDLQAKGISSQFDGVLVACYSVHSLVDHLNADAAGRGLVTTGIFEASILTALSILPPNTTGDQSGSKWGIVTTGKFWEQHLAAGVSRFLGTEPLDADEGITSSSPHLSKFAGVESSGLDAGDFHAVHPDEVRARLRAATLRLLLKGDVACVVMGCAGMAGLEDIIRGAAVEQYGRERGSRVAIVDGVKAGILQLDVLIRSRRLFA